MISSHCFQIKLFLIVNNSHKTLEMKDFAEKEILHYLRHSASRTIKSSERKSENSINNKETICEICRKMEPSIVPSWFQEF